LSLKAFWFFINFAEEQLCNIFLNEFDQVKRFWKEAISECLYTERDYFNQTPHRLRNQKLKEEKIAFSENTWLGLNFTNIFTLSFYTRRSQKRKKTDDLTVFYTLLCSASVKAVRRTLMKLNPGGCGVDKVSSELFCLSEHWFERWKPPIW